MAAIGYVACANGLVTISVVVVAVWEYDRLWLANPGLYCPNGRAKQGRANDVR